MKIGHFVSFLDIECFPALKNSRNSFVYYKQKMFFHIRTVSKNIAQKRTSTSISKFSRAGKGT